MKGENNSDKIMQEDYNEMRTALFKCRDLFRNNKKKLIDKNDYEKAAKARDYEKICTNALKVRPQGNYYCIIVTDHGVTSSMTSKDFMSRLGTYELAAIKLQDDKKELMDTTKTNTL